MRDKDDCISRQSAIEALNEYFARIGKLKRRGLTKGEKAISLDTVEAIKNLQPVEAIPVSWIEAKIELVNDLPGVSMLKMKAADWVDLIKQWRAEQRNPEVDHDAQIRELAEEMQKHGVHKPTADPSTAHTTEKTAEATAPSTDDWIPIKNRLSAVRCCRCLITRDDGRGRATVEEALFLFGGWYSHEWIDDGRNRKYNISASVIAWRPFPAPYRGGDSE